MRPDLEILEKIDAYLSGTMDGREKELFEQQLLSDPQLASWTETQRALRKAMDNLHLKHQAVQAFRSYKLWKGIKITGLVLGSVLACVLVYYGVKKFTSGTHHRENAEVNIVVPDCEGKENCFTPDNLIPSQYLDINTDADTVVVGNQGLVLVIPAHAFTDENGNPVSGHVQLELKEALDPATIMLSGLSTVSGSDPLETGGMFYLDARQNGKKLRISNEGILAHVPALEQKPGMMLYDGERKPDGSINWTNPKPVENFLLARDMNTLDFYPPGYVNKLQELGLNYESKHFRDSLYLTFEYAADSISNYPKDTLQPDATLSLDSEYLYPGQPLSISMQLRPIVTIRMPDQLQHKTVDYGSYGISPSRVLAFWNERFNGTNLATEEFEERMSYIHQSCNNAVLEVYVNNLDKPLYYCDSLAYQLSRDPKFLEFLALRQGNVEGPQANLLLLQEFYNRQSDIFSEVGVRTREAFFRKHAELDQKAFIRQLQQQDKEAQIRITQFNEEFAYNLDEAYRQMGYPRRIAVSPPSTNTASITMVTSQTIYSMYRNRNIRGVVAVINTVGWKNIDRKVLESVTNGTTLNYTDPSGKSAQIVYQDIQINIKDHSVYDQLMVYLVPSQLSAYLRLEGLNGNYTRGLNELLTYDLVVIGYRKKEIHMHIEQQAKPKRYDLNLNRISLTDAFGQLNKINNFKASFDIRTAIDYAGFIAEENERKDYLRMVEAMRKELWPVVYPCGELHRADTVDVQTFSSK